MVWQELKVTIAPNVQPDVESLLSERGAEGFSSLVGGEKQVLQAFFSQLSQEQVKRIEEDLKPYGEAEWSDVVQEDWSEAWKNFYEPQPLGKSLYIVPLWERGLEIPSGKVPMYLEPGQAFGTGQHASTQLCAQLLEEVLESDVNLKKQSLLDVGTGSGILAIAAHHLGVENVSAFDIDPVAVEYARKNLTENACEEVILWKGELGRVNQVYPLVLSNILLEVHEALTNDYLRVVGDHLVLAGLLVEQKEAICQKLVGFDVVASRVSGEWLALWCRKRKSEH